VLPDLTVDRLEHRHRDRADPGLSTTSDAPGDDAHPLGDPRRPLALERDRVNEDQGGLLERGDDPDQDASLAATWWSPEHAVSVLDHDLNRLQLVRAELSLKFELQPLQLQRAVDDGLDGVSSRLQQLQDAGQGPAREAQERVLENVGADELGDIFGIEPHALGVLALRVLVGEHLAQQALRF
jgi:hypothetical protein